MEKPRVRVYTDYKSPFAYIANKRLFEIEQSFGVGFFSRWLFLGGFCDGSERVTWLHRARHSKYAERKTEQETNEFLHDGAQPSLARDSRL